ncbi:putative transposase, partial [Candidatus Erwinia dacicola]
QQWTPGRLKNWAAGVGPDTLTWVSERLAEKAHLEQAYRLCLGLLSLTREYPSERVNNSCRLANTEGLNRLKQIKSILKNNRDLVPADGDSVARATSTETGNPIMPHTLMKQLTEIEMKQPAPVVAVKSMWVVHWVTMPASRVTACSTGA